MAAGGGLNGDVNKTAAAAVPQARDRESAGSSCDIHCNMGLPRRVALGVSTSLLGADGDGLATG
eukprot:1610644-Pyramimonas_sp.AAC.1